ncbi:MAG: phosphate ABC transporter permease subunit PstC [Hyphomicrobiaceae bacterium]
MASIYLLALAALAIGAYVAGSRRGAALRADGALVHSLPAYHGWFLASAAAVPMALVFVVWSAAAPKFIEARALATLPAAMQPADALQRATVLREIANVLEGNTAAAPKPEIKMAAGTLQSLQATSDWSKLAIGLALAALGFLWGRGQQSASLRARNHVERLVLLALAASSAVAVLTTVGIVLSVLFESLRFFGKYPIQDFLFGLQWSPQIALREDQVGQSGAFGAVPLFAGTTLIMLIAMSVAGPIGLLAAIYMSEYASKRFRAWAKPMLEILAGVPTVVFGFFAALTVAPLIRQLGESIGLDVASESALAAGLVMGVMIIPFVSSLSDDVINAVPQSLRDGSLAMGATKSETITRVVLPAALPGIVSAFMLAISRAVGETMIVVMAAGLAGNLTFNPLEAVTTITVQIKTLLVGDQEFDSVKTLSAFALGLVLFFFTLILNVIALKIVRKYREQYD